MKKFKTRLRYYLIGFGLGLIFMFFIFGNRACSWLPANRVKNMIGEKEIFLGDSVAALMECEGITNDDVYRFLNDDGDVDFSESDTKGSPKYYEIDGKKDGKDLSIRYALYDEKAEVVGFKFEGKGCKTELRNQRKSVIPVPDFEVIGIIESNEIRILEKAECQMKCYQLKESDILKFHRSATTIAEKSVPKAKPNPHYVMRGKIGSDVYEIKYIIGENRTRVASIEHQSQTCDCP